MSISDYLRWYYNEKSEGRIMAGKRLDTKRRRAIFQALDLDDRDLARAAERLICDEIATKQRLLWAIRARHGRAS